MDVLFYRPWEVCNLLRVSMWDYGRQLWGCHVSERRDCPNVAIGRSGTEGECGRHTSPPSPLARVFGRGFEVIFGRKHAQRLTLVKSGGRFDLTGEGTSERFDFRASRAVSSP
ncbi:unnamed protein product [Prunus armeniaca]